MSVTPTKVSTPAGDVLVFDLRNEPIALEAREWDRRKKRNPKAARGIALHQWGVKVGTTIGNRKRYGEEEALARRALGVPAHLSLGVTLQSQTPIVAICHPLDRHVYGSDDGNSSFVTVETMGSFPFEEKTRNRTHTEVTPQLAAAMSVGLQVTLDLLDEWSPRQGPWELVTHRQCCNSRNDHTACPGEAPVMMAMGAIIGGLGPRLQPNPDLVLDPKWGKPWPESWRSHLWIA